MRRLLLVKNPNLVLLMETRLKAPELEKVKKKCGMDYGLIIECKGLGKSRRGGLALLWNNEIDVSITSFSLKHISGVVQVGERVYPWKFAGIYGYSKERNKKENGI